MKEEDVVEMEVFRTGDYGAKGAYSEADLDQLVADYRADLLEAPLTFDHAQTGPAYGWVSRLRRDGDRLVAALKGVPTAVTDLLRRGAYKRRSVELFRKLPHTGRPYLRAVSLLGAATPEVKGLRDVCFASRQEACTVEFAEAGATTGPDAGATADSVEATKSVDARSDEAATAQADLRGMQRRFVERTDRMFSELRRDGYCLGERDAKALGRLLDVVALSTGNAAAPVVDAAAQMAAEAATTLADRAVNFAEDAIEDAFGILDGLLRKALLRAPLGQSSDAKADGLGQPGNGGARHRSAARLPAGSLAFSDGAALSDRMDPRSVSLHGVALQMMSDAPDLAYRDALLRAAGGR